MDGQTDHVTEIDTMNDSTFGIADNNDDNFAEFFSRPILIDTYSWTPNTPFPPVAINPWQAYFINKRVSNRISNFNLARAKLHVKVTINANQFYYGRLLVSYLPMHTSDDFIVSRGSLFEDNVRYSQRPHIFLDPNTAQGGELVLPFVWPWNAVNLPTGDFTNLGDLYFTELAILRHANNNTTNISINVYAWCEDMILSVPTSQNISGLVSQSGEEGMISTPAAVAAGVASKLAAIPRIRPYAMAADVALSSISALAKAFGYSRPSVVNDVMPMVPTFGNYANSNASETLNRMSLDQKAEVCVDSRVVGLSGVDEMAIKSIVTRESFLTLFTWTPANVTDVLLWNTMVAPIITAKPVAPNDAEYHLPAICHGSLPFRYWRGSIKYRFQIVSSSAHKGRLRFVWEPRYAVSKELNVAYNKIVDISTEKDFTIEIGWGNKNSWLETAAIGNSHTIYGTTPIAVANDLVTNGTLSVYVVNELSAMSAAAVNSVSVLVFVSAGDDFELVLPHDEAIGELSWLPAGLLSLPSPAPVPDKLYAEPFPVPTLDVQSGVEMVSDCCSVPFAPTTVMKMGSSVQGTDNIYKVMLPDPVASVRQVLKRYCFHSAIVPDALTGVVNISTEIRPDFPYYRGYNPDGPDQATGPAAYSYCEMTLLNWFTPAYVCRRGSIRWKYILTGPDGDVGIPRNYISAGPAYEVSAFSRSKITVAQTSTSNVLRASYAALKTGLGGQIVQPAKHNSVVQIEFPHNLNRRFMTARTANLLGGNDDHTFHYVSQYQGTTAGGTNNVILGYVAAGDDFDLSFYIGAPIVYIQPDPAAA